MRMCAWLVGMIFAMGYGETLVTSASRQRSVCVAVWPHTCSTHHRTPDSISANVILTFARDIGDDDTRWLIGSDRARTSVHYLTAPNHRRFRHVSVLRKRRIDPYGCCTLYRPSQLYASIMMTTINIGFHVNITSIVPLQKRTQYFS